MNTLSAFFAAALLLSPLSACAATTVSPIALPARFLAHTNVVSLAPAQRGTVGNDLLRNLPTLFVLDALFQNGSGGFLTPGPVSIQNILLLYRLFFTPSGFIEP